MANVVDNYKLVNIEIDGENSIERIDEKPWNVMVVEHEGKRFTIQEEDSIEFIVEDGEIIKGVVNKIIGKGEKTKIQISPFEKEYEQIWSVASIKEGSLKTI